MLQRQWDTNLANIKDIMETAGRMSFDDSSKKPYRQTWLPAPAARSSHLPTRSGMINAPTPTAA